MTSAFLIISLFKQSGIEKDQLTNFLFHLSKEALYEYLCNANIYNGKKRLLKSELIELIINDKPKDKLKSNKDNELTKDEAMIVLRNKTQKIKKMKMYSYCTSSLLVLSLN